MSHYLSEIVGVVKHRAFIKIPALKKYMAVVGSVVTGAIALPLVFSTAAYAENPDHVRQLLQTGDCPDCDLSNTVLQDLDLSQANLEGADLNNTQLIDIQLTRANLENANLSEAFFQNVDFTGATLASANLTDASSFYLCAPGFYSLEEDELAECVSAVILSRYSRQICQRESEIGRLLVQILEGYDDTDNYCEGIGIEQFFYSTSAYAALYRPSLKALGANLEGANLSGANLAGADLSYAILNDANASGADLSYTMMLNAQTTNLVGADLATAWQSESDVAEWLSAMSARAEERDRETYGRTYVGAMGRSQQAHYLESGSFVDNFEELFVGEKEEGALFELDILETSEYGAVQYALSQREDLPSVLGIVRIVVEPSENPAEMEPYTYPVLCEADTAGILTVDDLPNIDISGAIETLSEVSCPAGWSTTSG